MSEDSVADAQLSERPVDTTGELRRRLYRGEHLKVAEEYLDGVLAYSRDDWRAAALISLALKHHFAALERTGELTVDVATEQEGDGLALTVKWPQDRAIDEVDVAFEIVHDSGARSVISRSFAREVAAGKGLARVFGQTLASDQGIVFRPIPAAATVSAVAQPRHRLRFNERFLAPEMRTCRPGHDVAVRSSFEFTPKQSVRAEVVDVYGDARRRDVFEIISREEQQERQRRARAEQRRRRWKRALRVGAVTLLVIGVLLGLLFASVRIFPEVGELLPFLVPDPEASDSFRSTVSGPRAPQLLPQLTERQGQWR